MPNYQFPSQIKVDLSEIERPLRRKKEKKVNYLEWFVDILVAAILAGLILGLVVSIILLSV